MNASPIVIEHLTKTFLRAQGLRAFLASRRSAGSQALREVTFEVVQGEIFGLLGPNGGGKTTLLEVLATYLLPSSGRAWVNGHDVVRDPLAVRRAVGYCPAGARGFDQRLSGRRNLEFFALLSHLPRAYAQERVAHLWELVGLDRFSDGHVIRYSDGMRQRLALAEHYSPIHPSCSWTSPLGALTHRQLSAGGGYCGSSWSEPWARRFSWSPTTCWKPTRSAIGWPCWSRASSSLSDA